MAVIEEVRVPQTENETDEQVPSPRRPRGALVWVVAAAGVVAAVVVLVLALTGGGSDTGSDVTSIHGGLIENGSITAIDHAAEPVTGGQHLIIENGSITAIDHAAETGASPAGTTSSGDPGGLIENGSITAIDHAASGQP